MKALLFLDLRSRLCSNVHSFRLPFANCEWFQDDLSPPTWRLPQTDLGYYTSGPRCCLEGFWMFISQDPLAFF